MPCKCKSYNLHNPDHKGDPEVVLPAPSWAQKYRTGDSICVDHCIAEVIQTLWRNDVHTLNSCCGHNRYPPSIIVIPEHLVLAAAILKNEPRHWLIGAWHNDTLIWVTPTQLAPIKND